GRLPRRKCRGRLVRRTSRLGWRGWVATARSRPEAPRRTARPDTHRLVAWRGLPQCDGWRSERPGFAPVHREKELVLFTRGINRQKSGDRPSMSHLTVCRTVWTGWSVLCRGLGHTDHGADSRLTLEAILRLFQADAKLAERAEQEFLVSAQ